MQIAEKLGFIYRDRLGSFHIALASSNVLPSTVRQPDFEQAMMTVVSA
jgi:hypothetical protein